MDSNGPIALALALLTNSQKRELAALGITPQKRSDWIHTDRKPTVAQLKTLAIISGHDLAPMLEELANEQATPAQLDLFLRALAKGTAALAVVILAGAGNHADAASMRLADRFPSADRSAHYAQLMSRLGSPLAARGRSRAWTNL